MALLLHLPRGGGPLQGPHRTQLLPAARNLLPAVSNTTVSRPHCRSVLGRPRNALRAFLSERFNAADTEAILARVEKGHRAFIGSSNLEEAEAVLNGSA